MATIAERTRFENIDLEDPFFDSLRNDYQGFDEWFHRKANETAYVLRDEAAILGFMYLKLEDTAVDDVDPPLPPLRRLKIGTLKIEAHGTRLGQRFIKKALDHAVYEGAKELYVTVFSKHAGLISLLEEFGFTRHGRKVTKSGTEDVFLKSLSGQQGAPRLDYPRFRVSGNRKFILPIQPKWHTQLFPDSILANESYDVVGDVAHTNSIEKSYICFMDAREVSPGDLLVIYRTSDNQGPAEYRSVVTSICTVEEIRMKRSFADEDEYRAYSQKASVFGHADLVRLWRTKKRRELVVVRMLYNAALTKRLIRKALIEEVGVDRSAYPGFLELTDRQLELILTLGGVHETLAINQT